MFLFDREVSEPVGVDAGGHGSTSFLLCVKFRADPEGRTSTAADSLFHERQQNRKAHRLQEGTATPASAAAPVVAMEEKAVMSATTTLGWDFFKRRQSSSPSMPGML
jgi:hypothetical protein